VLEDLKEQSQQANGLHLVEPHDGNGPGNRGHLSPVPVVSTVGDPKDSCSQGLIVVNDVFELFRRGHLGLDDHQQPLQGGRQGWKIFHPGHLLENFLLIRDYQGASYPFACGRGLSAFS